MRIEYSLNNMPKLKQALCFGDLLRYYGERKYKMIESVRRISENEGLKVKLLNQIRKHTKVAGLTLDALVNNLENVSCIDIFQYKINGVDPTIELFKNDNNISLEVYMNPIYFTTEATIKNFLPIRGRRRYKKVDETELEFKARKEQENWVKYFEKELNKYHSRNLWEKKVIE